jgi:hypothetical protein
MRILSLEYFDASTNWRLNPIEFDRLTLLVGASGVGKTEILRSILSLKKISEGYSFSGIKWELKFSTSRGGIWHWAGEFETSGWAGEPKIIFEKLACDNIPLIDRDLNQIRFNGVPTVKLSPQTSAISLLKEENDIRVIYDSLQLITLTSIPRLPSWSEPPPAPDVNKYCSIVDIRESNENMITKLYLSSLNAKDTFDRIKFEFIAIFPYVEDIQIRRIDFASKPGSATLTTRIKERGVEQWIDQSRISSGMLRTLYHLAELYLCQDGTVILIDEFENSLGANCISEVTDAILNRERDIQVILTSHHPYIINNIDYSHWKIVTRKAGVVTARNAREFNLGKSKHEAFMRLMNLDEYVEGISA